MPKSKYKIITAMFDIKPMDDLGNIDVAKIYGIQTVLNLGNQKPAKNAGNGGSRLRRNKTILDSNSSIANTDDKSSVDSSFIPGPEGIRTPEIHLSRMVSSQTGPRVESSYQEKINPQQELERYLNEDVNTQVELVSMGAQIHENQVLRPRYRKSIKYPVVSVKEKQKEYNLEPEEIIPILAVAEEIVRHEEVSLDSWETKYPVLTSVWPRAGKILKKKPLLVLAGFVISSIAFFGSYGLNIKNELVLEGNSAVANLENAGENIKNGDFVSASNNFSQAYQEFSKAGDGMNFMGAGISSLLSDLPGAGKLKSAKKLVEAGKLMANAGQAMSEAMGEIAKTNLILSPLDPPAGGAPGSDVSIGKISASLKKALTLSKKNLSKAKQLLADIDDSNIPEDKRASFKEFESKLPLFEKLINDSVDYSKFLEDFIGTKGTKKYLILFQNPSELRPTGGFPGTYGVVSFKDGKLQDFQVDDVYNLDGQLKELIIPPLQLQHITPNWGMRDANWFIDFPTSARKITEFYKKESGQDVDGVITFSPKIVARILDIVGPVEMPEYNLTLDSNNLLPTLQEEVEYNGDRKQPKQIIMDLAPRMLEKLYSAESGKWLEIFNILIASMEQKDILMYFRDLNLESFSVDKGFSGQVINTESDYLMVTFTNVKGSKTDLVMDSSLKVQTTAPTLRSGQAESGGVKHKVSITRTHNGGGSKYGFYNKQSPTYVRVLVPENAEFIDLTGNSRPNFKPLIDYTNSEFKKDEDLAKFEEESYTDQETGVTVYKEAGKTEFGFWMIINPGETRTVDLEYTVPSSGEGYQFYVQKQPGLDINDFKFYMDEKTYFDGRLEKDMVIIPSWE